MDFSFTELNVIMHYMILFFVLTILFILCMYFASHRKISNKNIGIYGIFMSLDNIDALKISLLIVCYLFILELTILTEINYYLINFILIPIISFEIINKTYYKILVDIFEIAFIYFIFIFKNIYFAYLNDVNMLWYVLVLYVIICVFIILFGTYFLFENINMLMNKKRKMIK